MIIGIVVTEDLKSAEDRVHAGIDRGSEFAQAALFMGQIKKMDEDLIINPNWSDQRQNRCAAFGFFSSEMNQSENLRDDLSEFISKLGQKEEFFSYAVELIDGVIEKRNSRFNYSRLGYKWDFSRVAKADLAI